MSNVSKLDAELERLETVQRDTAAALKQVKQDKVKALRAEQIKRDQVMGGLAREAGLADWDNAKLMAAFKSISEAGPTPFKKMTTTAD